MLAIDDYLKREFRIAALMAQMRLNGIRVDLDLLRTRLDQAQARKEAGVATLVGYGMPLRKPPTATALKKDPNALGEEHKSPHVTKEGKAAILAALSSRGIDVDRLPRTETGQVSLSGESMAWLVEKIKADPERLRSKEGGDVEGAILIAETVAELASIRTVYGTVDKYRYGDRVFPEVDTLQASGRLSITKPGMTVFGKRGERYLERGIFLAEPGEVFLCFDYDQIDARCVAVHSQDEDYMALFGLDEHGAPIDAHMEIACLLWGEEVRGDRTYRNMAKPNTHGYAYGLGIKTMAANNKISIEEAKRVINTLRERFPGVVEWQEKIRAEGAGGYIRNGWGRRCAIDSKWAYTQSPAEAGQGTARDVMMQGALDLPKHRRKNLKTIVHDEAVFSIPIGEVEEATEEIIDAFQRSWKPPWCEKEIRFTVGVSRPGERWSDCYSKAA